MGTTTTFHQSANLRNEENMLAILMLIGACGACYLVRIALKAMSAVPKCNEEMIFF